ncbi:D-lactate/D-glycerate dehydrogenase [Apilactobacillus kunkeei]|nr:D-lactate/D-glycerate dehydrogenase [Apilactobacillus kunkeei]CAI2610585.1 D-lactate/D-glycerate dehydrogenase [Apilactobacillus kunkeei]CAI2611932.1 D-lactate/D-glycerate dehydrogenase [Apilactobacillus kunkeei]CAI2612110.1 D-lactate/D-glycerate dehydrogenase [Apilactobacillus kunkeei]CAI2612112.1 D-lactate/D-glycerate dehydrogenase [Apilactobacillus kunkeei]
MKIIAYGIRNDEMPYLKEWEQKNPEVEVKVETKLLDSSTVEEANGFDGVVAYQQKPYTKEILDKLGSFNIKYLSLRNVGVDNVDSDAAKANGITVTNVPAYSPNAIAELAIAEIMRLLRNTKRFEDKQRSGDLRWAPEIGQELNSKTVGVFGTGRIGHVLVDICRGFGAKVIAYDPFRNPELEKQGIYVDTPDDLYKQADIISLHAPAVKENEHMVNDKTLSEMKDGSYIINAARGSLIDTDALIRALDSGKLAGAALDTYESEVGVFNVNFDSFDDISDNRLKNLMSRDNVLITPHIAFYTETAVRNMVTLSLDANRDLINTGKSDKIVKL